MLAGIFSGVVACLGPIGLGLLIFLLIIAIFR